MATLLPACPLLETAGLLSKHTEIWSTEVGELKCVPKSNDCQGGLEAEGCSTGCVM